MPYQEESFTVYRSDKGLTWQNLKNVVKIVNHGKWDIHLIQSAKMHLGIVRILNFCGKPICLTSLKVAPRGNSDADFLKA